MQAFKPKYIRKYDFIRTFTRPEAHYFFRTCDIEQHIIDAINSSHGTRLPIAEIEDDVFAEEVETNFYDEYKETKSETKDLNIDMDLNDPKILEGNLIDKLSTKFIEEHFKSQDEYEVFHIENNNNTLELRAQKTLEHIDTGKNYILFQPVFIARKKAVAIPDALIISNREIILVEVKGTTKTKGSHFLDVYYQEQIINDVLKTRNKHMNKCYMCLVKQELLNKNEISFDLFDKFRLKKTPKSYTKVKGDTYGAKAKFSDLALNEKQTDINESGHNYFLLKEALISSLKYSDDEKDKIESTIKQAINKESKGRQPIPYNNAIKIRELYKDNYFFNKIEELYNFEPYEKIKIFPSNKYQFCLLDSEYFMLYKSYLKALKTPPFGVTGNILNYSKVYEVYKKKYLLQNIQEYNLKEIISDFYEEYFKQTESYLWKYHWLLQRKWEKNQKYYVEDNAASLFKKIKNKKIYFDFESLNLATRVVDSTPPFLQIVNQVSVIKDDGTTIYPCNNIVIDPKEINANSFKTIIDSLYVEDFNDYSYIVYNQSFEKTRLDEMAAYIDEDDYYIKVRRINDNLFDLADFFSYKRGCKQQIIIWDLHGFYSIKFVLEWVMNEFMYEFKKAKCENYSTLAIKKGDQAQKISTLRFYNKIDDESWEKDVQNLKIYCENDVRAMLCIYNVVKKIIKDKL